MNNKLLTIGIPTYNRAPYLDKCLEELLSQAKDFLDIIEIQISDNCSTDTTSQIVKKYQELGYKIDYAVHPKNIGMDKNFASLYERCKTKYMWMLSDDDFLLPNALNKILDLLKHKDLGVLYLSNYWYEKEVDFSTINSLEESRYTKYDDPIAFVDRVNYWFTFISGNIINKSIVEGKINYNQFDGTFLLLLGWIIPAVFQGKPSYVLENPILACKANNAGGYKLFTVFGKNFNKVLNRLTLEGYDARIKYIINNHLLKTFFPMFLTRSNKNFVKEKYLSSLLPEFWRYKTFWKSIFPTLLKQQLNLK